MSPSKGTPISELTRNSGIQFISPGEQRPPLPRYDSLFADIRKIARVHVDSYAEGTRPRLCGRHFKHNLTNRARTISMKASELVDGAYKEQTWRDRLQPYVFHEIDFWDGS